jgi:2-amino-4-hydroxy-6-hydroxymethyldihydropteridine diphosphokinase
MKIYLSLGSNLGDRERHLQDTLDLLQAPDLRILRISPVYETEPREVRNQPWFLNLVVEAQTDLFPKQLLARTSKIERQLGRRRLIEKGPRTVDIDILFIGSFVLRTSTLTVPHPRFAERRFVLAPLADLVPEWRDPVSRRSVRELLAGTADQNVRRVDFRPVLRAAE